METTKPWQSKTLWASFIVAAAPFFPPAQAVIVANPELVATAVGALFALLRLLSGKTLPLVGTSGQPVSVSSPGAVVNLDKK